MSVRKTLLLDASYQVQSFVCLKKAIKLLVKEKTEVISSWDEYITYGSGRIKYPAILRLKNSIKRNYFNSNFSRRAVIKRDKSRCQFCGKILSVALITIDHVIPRAQGGTTSFMNCVVACKDCNNKKADSTPEQAGMPLLKRPMHPAFTSLKYVNVDNYEHWHPEWDGFLNY